MGLLKADQLRNAAGTGNADLFKQWAVKARARINFSGGVPSVALGSNIASLVDTGTGDLTINLTSLMSSVDWMPMLTNKIAGSIDVSQTVAQTTSSVRVISNTVGGSSSDPASYSFTADGDLA